MTIDPSTAMACPMCGYDLRGTFDGVETFSCPECGHRCSIPTLAARAVHRERSRRTTWLSTIVAMAGFGVFALGGVTLSAHTLGRIDVLFALATFGGAWVASLRWPEMTMAERAVYSSLPSLLFIYYRFGPTEISGLIVLLLDVAWFVGYEVRAIRRHFKSLSNA